MKRISDRTTKLLRPVRKGESLTLTTVGRGNAQLTNISVIGVLIGLLLPAVQSAREAARRTASMNNIRQIGLAIVSHESTDGRYPARAIFDKQGKPLVSWRVQMLPYLGQETLYKQFHLDEPWDSDHNKQLIPLMPHVFQNPSSPPRPGMTPYLGVSGEGLFFDGDKRRTPATITDGLSNTIMVVEVNDDQAVTWTKPDDWQYDKDHPLAGLGSAHPSGFNALFCDGSVRILSKGIDPTVFRALLTIAGGEVIGNY
jgi:prepilin-type processing-associated H-X9-DG protein